MGCTSSKKLSRIVSTDKLDDFKIHQSNTCDSILTVTSVTSNTSFQFNEFLNDVKNNQLSAVDCEIYLQNEPDAIFAYDSKGDTAIHFAAINRNLELLRVLVRFKVHLEKAVVKQNQLEVVECEPSF
jgi:ankyrin repeat protein